MFINQSSYSYLYYLFVSLWITLVLTYIQDNFSSSHPSIHLNLLNKKCLKLSKSMFECFFFIFPKSKNDQVRAIFVVHICQIWGSDGILAATYWFFYGFSQPLWQIDWRSECQDAWLASWQPLYDSCNHFYGFSQPLWPNGWHPGCQDAGLSEGLLHTLKIILCDIFSISESRLVTTVRWLDPTSLKRR